MSRREVIVTYPTIMHGWDSELLQYNFTGGDVPRTTTYPP